MAQVINDGLMYYEEGRVLNDSEDETDDDAWVSETERNPFVMQLTCKWHDFVSTG